MVSDIYVFIFKIKRIIYLTAAALNFVGLQTILLLGLVENPKGLLLKCVITIIIILKIKIENLKNIGLLFNFKIPVIKKLPVYINSISEF